MHYICNGNKLYAIKKYHGADNNVPSINTVSNNNLLNQLEPFTVESTCYSHAGSGLANANGEEKFDPELDL